MAEPFLDATIRPQILFPAYFRGMNLAESFYLAMPNVSWQTIVVGDPLCAPFRKEAIPATALDPGLDPDTSLPKWFSARRVGTFERKGLNPVGVKALLKAQVLLTRGDRPAPNAPPEVPWRQKGDLSKRAGCWPSCSWLGKTMRRPTPSISGSSRCLPTSSCP